MKISLTQSGWRMETLALEKYCDGLTQCQYRPVAKVSGGLDNPQFERGSRPPHMLFWISGSFPPSATELHFCPNITVGVLLVYVFWNLKLIIRRIAFSWCQLFYSCMRQNAPTGVLISKKLREWYPELPYAVFEKTYATTQKNVKSHVFWIFKKM